MGFFLVLGLALLHALAGNVPTHRGTGWQEQSAPLVRALHVAVGDVDAVVARATTSAKLDRTAGGAPRVPPAINTAFPQQAPIAPGNASRNENAARVIASRGSLLAYYATAPPVTD